MNGNGLDGNRARRFVTSVRKLLKGMNLNVKSAGLLQGKELGGLGCDFTREYSTGMIVSQVTVLNMNNSNRFKTRTRENGYPGKSGVEPPHSKRAASASGYYNSKDLLSS